MPEGGGWPPQAFFAECVELVDTTHCQRLVLKMCNVKAIFYVEGEVSHAVIVRRLPKQVFSRWRRHITTVFCLSMPVGIEAFLLYERMNFALPALLQIATSLCCSVKDSAAYVPFCRTLIYSYLIDPHSKWQTMTTPPRRSQPARASLARPPTRRRSCLCPFLTRRQSPYSPPPSR